MQAKTSNILQLPVLPLNLPVDSVLFRSQQPQGDFKLQTLQ